MRPWATSLKLQEMCGRVIRVSCKSVDSFLVERERVELERVKRINSANAPSNQQTQLCRKWRETRSCRYCNTCTWIWKRYRDAGQTRTRAQGTALVAGARPRGGGRKSGAWALTEKEDRYTKIKVEVYESSMQLLGGFQRSHIEAQKNAKHLQGALVVTSSLRSHCFSVFVCF